MYNTYEEYLNQEDDLINENDYFNREDSHNLGVNLCPICCNVNNNTYNSYCSDQCYDTSLVNNDNEKEDENDDLIF